MENISLYRASVPVFTRCLGNLGLIIDKAAAHVDAKKIDPAALLAARLYPDMLPFTRQVQIASDFAKGTVSRLAGLEPPAWADDEASFADLKSRLQRTVTHIQSFKPAQFAGAEERSIEIKLRSGPVTFTGLVYLLDFALPNFYFHYTTAYDILRHNGIEIGKRDFLGPAE